jgi:hypothetical protein
MLVDIAGVTAGPQLYDSSADPLAIMNGRVGPIFHDVLFAAADLLAAFPASGGEAPPKLKGAKSAPPVQAPRKPLLLDKVVETLPRYFPAGRGERDTYRVILARFKQEGVTVSETTLKRAFRRLGWV